MAGSGVKGLGTVSVFSGLYGDSTCAGGVAIDSTTIIPTTIIPTDITAKLEKLEQQEATIKQLLLTQAELLNAIHDLKLRVEELELKSARPIEKIGSDK